MENETPINSLKSPQEVIMQSEPYIYGKRNANKFTEIATESDNAIRTLYIYGKRNANKFTEIATGSHNAIRTLYIWKKKRQ